MSRETEEDDPLEKIGHGTSRCRFCGTIYDGSWVDLSDYVPPVGDGCEKCGGEPPEREPDPDPGPSDAFDPRIDYPERYSDGPY